MFDPLFKSETPRILNCVCDRFLEFIFVFFFNKIFLAVLQAAQSTCDITERHARCALLEANLLFSDNYKLSVHVNQKSLRAR